MPIFGPFSPAQELGYAALLFMCHRLHCPAFIAIILAG
jgi:hypothetical protein